MLTDDTGAKVIFTLKIFDQEKLSEVPFFMQVSMKGFFRWDESMDEEIYKKLLRTNAPAILLSYIRPFVSQLTSASGYPPLILPLIDFSSNEILEIT
jgi:preprotein translocase subunit SecB